MGAQLERTIDAGPGGRGTVSAGHPVLRYAGNPVLTSADVNRVWDDPGLQVVTVHNAGAAIIDGETALLFRSHLRCGRSVLGAARSSDGVTGWQVYFWRGQGWSNAQSSGDVVVSAAVAPVATLVPAAPAASAAAANPSASSPAPSASSASAPPAGMVQAVRTLLPSGIRLQIDLPEGRLLRDVLLPPQS